jgi:hypothetical protein
MGVYDALGAGVRRRVLVQLPPDKDPGDFPRQDLREMVFATALQQGVGLATAVASRWRRPSSPRLAATRRLTRGRHEGPRAAPGRDGRRREAARRQNAPRSRRLRRQRGPLRQAAAAPPRPPVWMPFPGSPGPSGAAGGFLWPPAAPGSPTGLPGIFPGTLVVRAPAGSRQQPAGRRGRGGGAVNKATARWASITSSRRPGNVPPAGGAEHAGNGRAKPPPASAGDVPSVVTRQPVNLVAHVSSPGRSDVAAGAY